MNKKTKRCNKCKKWKKFSEFHKNRTTKDGYATYCKNCKAKYNRVWYKKRNSNVGQYRSYEKMHRTVRNEKQKRCSTCDKWKTATIEFFTSHKQTKDDLNPRCKKCQNIVNRKHYHKPEIKRKTSKKQKEYFRNNKLKQRYNITPEDWDKMFEAQKGRCAICGKHQSELNISLCVDHDHKTGKIRGLLCRSCNAKLAIVEDKQFYKTAQRYLNNGC